MDSTTKSPDKRSGERRGGDRRKTAAPIARDERRVAQRRTARDRRD
jgi:hypothetical protein